MSKQSNEKETMETKKPNETQGVHMEGHIKIFDPKATKCTLTNVMLFITKT